MPIEKPDQQAYCHPAHLLQRLPDSGEEWRGRAAEVEVVEAGDGQVSRYGEAAIGRRLQGADRGLVVEGDQSCGAIGKVEQLACRAATLLGGRSGSPVRRTGRPGGTGS